MLAVHFDCVVDWHIDMNSLLRNETDIISITLDGPVFFCFAPNTRPGTEFGMSLGKSQCWEKDVHLAISNKVRGVVATFPGDIAYGGLFPGAYATQDAFEATGRTAHRAHPSTLSRKEP